LVEHEINLTDDKPYREPYGRIPPSMFDEVREHLREMLEIGAIRESSSPYSSNLVLVRKSDGSLRLCIKSLEYLSVLPKSVCLMTFTSFNPQIIHLGFRYTTLVVILNILTGILFLPGDLTDQQT
jgi:hypothetical protein